MSGKVQVSLVLFALVTLPSCQDQVPRSTLTYHPSSVVEWIWSGGLRTDGAVIKARLAQGVDASTVGLLVSRQPDFREPIRFPASTQVNDDRVVRFAVKGLVAATRFYYVAVEGSRQDEYRRGTFQTLPESGSFTLALGACARTASTAAVFDSLRRVAPLFFIHLGDFHYENLPIADVDAYRRVYHHVLASPAQSAFYRQTPTVYVWDDHDYGPDNSDAAHVGRSAARQTYREIVPHYRLAAGEGDHAIYHSFQVGRVRFVVTDGRSERSPRAAPDNASKTLLGEQQKAWLKRELTRDRDEAPLIVWVNTVPWIAARQAGADHWGGYSAERQELAQFLIDEGVTGLAMLSGDAHMLAIDDGSHNSFSEPRGTGFPVFHTAALDRPGSVKGGPYSEGRYPGRGQYGVMQVQDNGSEIVVSWSGRNWRDEELISYQFTVPEGTR